jgi:hypothetical protein
MKGLVYVMLPKEVKIYYFMINIVLVFGMNWLFYIANGFWHS